MKHDHEVSWKGALTALRADTDDRTKVAVEAARQEERELVNNEMSHAMEELTRQHTERLEEKTREKEELTAAIDELKKVSKKSMHSLVVVYIHVVLYVRMYVYLLMLSRHTYVAAVCSTVYSYVCMYVHAYVYICTVCVRTYVVKIMFVCTYVCVQ